MGQQPVGVVREFRAGPRVKKATLHAWFHEMCGRCALLRWRVTRLSGGRVYLYGRDGVNWSTARPECAPPPRGVAAVIPEGE